MHKHLIMCVAVSVSLSASAVYAASGDSWEVTSKTDMPGMPAGMGETTTTVCVPKGAEKDPNQFMKQESGCKVTDLKNVGSKTTWKMHCDNDGEVISGNGEVVHKKDSYRGVTRLSGASTGTVITMFHGKRTGTQCDTSAVPAGKIKGMENLDEMMGLANRQMESTLADQCEVSNYTPAELISNRFFGPKAICSNSEKFACKVINSTVSKDSEVYIKLARHDDTSDVSIAKTCAIDMRTATRAICKGVDSDNYRKLAEYCPSEARAFETETGPGENSGDAPAGSVIEGAKKLKGLFGF